MYRNYLWLIISAFVFYSCKKENGITPVTPIPDPVIQKILLKDIVIPRLPSPYYHFEYNSDSLVSKADFGSGFTMYDVLYSESKISEMRNNIIVNHDTLRYKYDNEGKLTVVNFINDANIVYRHVSFTYNGELIKEIKWDRKTGNNDFMIDRELTFTFYPDGNVKTMTDHRTSFAGSPDQTLITMFEEYDRKINVDDFSLIHDGIHDHLFLLQGFRLQKNNPRKETFSVDGVNLYTVNYTYTYNTDNTPSTKKGDLLFASGPDSGKRFETNSLFSYY